MYIIVNDERVIFVPDVSISFKSHMYIICARVIVGQLKVKYKNAVFHRKRIKYYYLCVNRAYIYIIIIIFYEIMFVDKIFLMNLTFLKWTTR